MEQHLPPPVPFLVLLLFFSLSISSHLFPGLCSASSSGEQFVFSGFDDAGKLTLDGEATVSSESRILELTNNGENTKGHAFYPTPFRFRDDSSSSLNGTAAKKARSFSAHFVFAIISGYPNTISTDGMAFLVSPTANLSDASAAQYMGFLDGAAMNGTLAVELDTVQNVPELRDVDGNHVGLDVAGPFSTPARAAGFYHGHDGGTFSNLSLDGGEALQVWMEYDGTARRVDVTLAPLGVGRPSRPLLTNVSDQIAAVLTAGDGEFYVGFSAATGPIRSRHCVLAWSFAVDGPAPPIDFDRVPRPPSNRNNSPQSKKNKALKIALPVAAALFIVAAGVVLFVRMSRRTWEVMEDWEVEFGPHRFSYRDLHRATDGFSSRNVLGVGGFGKVYRGVLPSSGSEVAVKRVSHDSSQGIREFVSEVVSVGHLRHRNLVHLLGYCRRRKGELLLVYDYMPNGSLDRHLYCGSGESEKAVLEWDVRFRIVKDVASGLLYLHEKWDKVVVHRDVKASNVLLDAAMNARLGDFGLARLYDHGGADLDAAVTRVVGTMGYMAPELARSGKASPLTDVFAFGAFLLEVVCGRRPVAQRGGKAVLLVDRVLQYWRSGALMETVDPRLRGNYSVPEARTALTLGLMCSHPFPTARPTMRQVVQYLDGDAPLPELTPADLSMLSMMQSGGGDEEAGVAVAIDDPQQQQQYPWSDISMATMTPDITEGR